MILNELQKESTWRAFFRCREEKARFATHEEEAWRAFIDSGAWRDVAGRALLPEFCFAPPEKKRVNKLGAAKKRVVYSYGEEETRLLKVIAWLLYRYDGAQADNCYAFRQGQGARQAVRRMTSLPGVDGLWCLKLDVRDYFNSIPIPALLPVLKKLLLDDPALYRFFERLLTADEAVEEGVLIREKRGVMAGVPIAPFLANVYLMDLDVDFAARSIPYARYSDDVILFAKTQEELQALRQELEAALFARGLALNPDKLHVSAPGEPWEFLGVSYQAGQVDLSRATREKFKGKVRRKARALYRWKLQKGAGDAQAMAAFARALNRKLYDNPRPDELTWARWFFPLLTTDGGLRELDGYIQEHMRYIATGRFTKANFRISYEQLKGCGYRSLVNEYYHFKKQGLSHEEHE